MATDYESLSNKPSINGVELHQNLTIEDIGIQELPPDMVNKLIAETFGVIIGDKE